MKTSPKENSESASPEPIEVKAGSVVVRIYHTPGDSYDGWTLVYYDTDGQRKRLFRSDLAKAKLEAETLSARLARAQAAVLKVSDADIAELVRARELLAPFGKSLELGAAEYADILTRMKDRGSPVLAIESYLKQHSKTVIRRSVTEAVADLVEAKEQDGRGDRHVKDLRLRLAAFAKDFQCPVADITGQTIETWLRAEQKANGWSGRTRNHYRANISALMNFAKTRNYLPRDWSEMMFVTKAREEDGEISVLTPDDFKKILEKTPAELLPFVALGGFTGARPSEIQRCDWSDLHWDAGEFFIGRGKVRTAGHRVAPLLPNCIAWLKPHKKTKGPLCTLLNPYNTLREAVKDAGIAWTHDGPRHSYVSYRLAVTKNLPQVSKETGTDVKTLTKRYCRPVSKATAEAWFNLFPA